MNDTSPANRPAPDEEAFARALASLATHADGHAPVNRLAAVERTAHRRAVVRRSGFALSAAAVVGLAAGVVANGTAWFHAGQGAVVAVITTQGVAPADRQAAAVAAIGDAGRGSATQTPGAVPGTVGLGAEPSIGQAPARLPTPSSTSTQAGDPTSAPAPTQPPGAVLPSATAATAGTVPSPLVAPAAPTAPATPSAAAPPAAPAPTPTPVLPPAQLLITAAAPATPHPSATPAPTASLNVTLRKTSAEGVRAVTVVADLAGLVPQYVDPSTGALAPAKDVEPLFTKVTFGDGAADGGDSGDVACKAGTPLVPLTQSVLLKHSYAKAGTYTITFSTGACAPIATVTRTLVVSVS